MQGAWHQKGKQTVLCGKQLNTYEKFPPPPGGGGVFFVWKIFGEKRQPRRAA